MCHFDPSIHGADLSMAGAMLYENQPRPHYSIVPTVLGIISVAASIFSTCIFCATGSLISLGCAVASGLLAVFLFSRSCNDDGPQRQTARVVHHVYQEASPPPPAVFVAPLDPWPQMRSAPIPVPVIPQPVSRPSGEDHVQVRSRRPVFSPPVAEARGEDHVQVRSHAPTFSQPVAPPHVSAPAMRELDANARIGVRDGSTNGVQPFGDEQRIPVGRGRR